MVKTTSKKKAVATAPAKKREVSTDNVDISLMMRQDAGRGVSTSAEDNIIPLIYVLQSLSPQALKQKQEYIKGAAAGNIWPRGSKTLIDGDEGVPVILAAVRKWWVEWRPERGQGLAGKHEYVEKDMINKGRPGDAEQIKDPKTGNVSWVRAVSGNVLVETREHAVLAYIDGKWSPYVISMKGSDHKCAREWNGERMRKQLPPPNDDIRPPSYAFVYNLKTVAKTNDRGDWYGWAYENGMGDGEVTEITSLENGVELYQMARALDKAFMAGDKNAELEHDEAGDDVEENDI